MKKAVLTAVLAVVAGTAAAQIVEHNRSNSQTSESQNSYSNSTSINKTIPVGLLFFPKLAEYEKATWNGVQLDSISKTQDEVREQIINNNLNFFRKKMTEGKMPDLHANVLIMHCNLFSTDGRIVWSHDQSRNVTSSFVNGTISFNESPYAPGSGDIANYSPEAKRLLGYPVYAAESARCGIFYSMLIDAAIEKMIKRGAKLKNQNISMRNIEEESEKALWEGFYSFSDLKRYDLLPNQQQCMIPTAEGSRMGGAKEFKCGDISISQSPLRVTRAGIIMLDQNTINGRTWLFSESTTAANSNSNKRTNTRGTNQRANVAN